LTLADKALRAKRHDFINSRSIVKNGTQF
jgi:hypothetical protein